MGRHSRQAQPAASEPGPRGHRGRRKHHPVRTGLLTTSAVMAVGAVAASSGLLSGVTGGLTHDGGGKGNAQADGPTGPVQAGSDLPSPQGSTDTAIPGSGSPSPSATPSPSAPRPSARAGAATPAKARPSTSASASPTRTALAPTTPVRTATATATKAPTASPSSDTLTSARAAVLSLVNQERATAGCKPLTASSSLDGLAQAFSDDMAARDFFDHTDPDGHTPWDRAKARGITNLGGENIARGQADAEAVMTAWMNSPGHRANILNCDYTTLGVGIHYGPGGPWWTQDFGF